MSSISVSEYRTACRSLIGEILLRPRMYFRSLDELEAMMRGHQAAFEQLHVIDRGQSFHENFADWLRGRTEDATATGWAYSIQTLATTEGRSGEQLFAELVTKFLAQWEKK